MKRKPIFTIIAIIIAIAIYSYDYYLNEEQKAEVVNEGQTVKSDTNDYYLPTSTTNQIVHHQSTLFLNNYYIFVYQLYPEL